MKTTTLFNKHKLKKITALFGLVLVLAIVALIGENPAKAEDFFIQESIPANRMVPYFVSSTNNQLSFSVSKGTSTEDLFFSLFTVLPQSEIKSNFDYGEDLIPASDLYSLTIGTTSQAVIADFNPQVIFKYPFDNRLYNIYLWDELSNAFIRIASVNDLKNQLAILTIKDYGRLIFALFEEKSPEGMASWYVHPRYRTELMAASTQFPKGAKVKVTNLANNKSVIVTIKDWGPDPVIHPDRVIDLNKVAFAKIASTRAGVIRVRVEPVIEDKPITLVNK